MRPERPSLLTYKSSDGYLDHESYTRAMVDYLLEHEEPGWEDDDRALEDDD